LVIKYDSNNNPVAVVADSDYWSDKGGVPDALSGAMMRDLFEASKFGLSGSFDVSGIRSAIGSAPNFDELVVTTKRSRGNASSLGVASKFAGQRSMAGFMGTEIGSNIFVGLIGVSGSAGRIVDSNGTVCTYHQECVQLGTGAYVGIVGQGIAGFGLPLEDGTFGTLGVFAVGSIGGGGFGTLDVNASSLTIGAGISDGFGGAAGGQYCTITFSSCQ